MSGVSFKPESMRDPSLWYRDHKLTFGKYRGTPLRDVPDDYLSWLMDDDARRDQRTRTAIEQEWAHRRKR